MAINNNRYSESGDSPILGENDQTEATEIVDPKRVHPLMPAQTPRRNNIAYIIIAICLYFQENFYAALIPSIVPADRAGLCLGFMFIPATIFKLFLMNFFSRFSVKTRMAFASLGFTVSASAFFLLLMVKSVRDSSTHSVIISIVFSSLTSFSMGLGEVSALEDASTYQKTCAANYSTGHGLSGVISSGIALLLGLKFKEKSEKRFMLPVAIVPGILLFITEFFILGTRKFPPKTANKKELSKNARGKGDAKPKQKYSTFQMFKLLFFGPFTYYSFSFFFDYMLYFLAYAGVVTVSKKVLKFKEMKDLCLKADPNNSNCSINKWLNDQDDLKKEASNKTGSFFEIAFFILKVCTFACKLLPYFISFYKVALFPAIHGPTILALIFCTKFACYNGVILGLAAFVGIAHGLTSSFVIIALRKKIEERWLKFGLKYITVASSFGGSFGCLVSLLLSNLMEIWCGVNF